MYCCLRQTLEDLLEKNRSLSDIFEEGIPWRKRKRWHSDSIRCFVSSVLYTLVGSNNHKLYTNSVLIWNINILGSTKIYQTTHFPLATYLDLWFWKACGEFGSASFTHHEKRPLVHVRGVCNFFFHSLSMLTGHGMGQRTDVYLNSSE